MSYEWQVNELCIFHIAPYAASDSWINWIKYKSIHLIESKCYLITSVWRCIPKPTTIAADIDTNTIPIRKKTETWSADTDSKVH